MYVCMYALCYECVYPYTTIDTNSQLNAAAFSRIQCIYVIGMYINVGTVCMYVCMYVRM